MLHLFEDSSSDSEEKAFQFERQPIISIIVFNIDKLGV